MDHNHYIMLYNPPWAGPHPERIGEADTPLNTGNRIDFVPGLFRFELRVDPKAADPSKFPPLDWHDVVGRQPLFSARMIRCLQDAGATNIDYYPAQVKYVPDGSTPSYSAANIIGSINGLDREKSEYDGDADGTVFDIQRIVLDEGRLHGVHIARLNEWPQLIIISRHLRDAIKAVNLTGITMIADDEWEPGMI